MKRFDINYDEGDDSSSESGDFLAEGNDIKFEG
jgi:hypothetical protein